MSLDATRLQVETLFKGRMTATYPNIGLSFGNADLATGEGTRACVWVLDGEGRATNIGSRVIDRHVGIVQVNVSAPVRLGTAQGNQIAEFCGNIFRRQQFILADNSILRFRVPSYSFRDAGSEGFAHVVMKIAYWRDEPATA